MKFGCLLWHIMNHIIKPQCLFVFLCSFSCLIVHYSVQNPKFLNLPFVYPEETDWQWSELLDLFLVSKRVKIAGVFVYKCGFNPSFTVLSIAGDINLFLRICIFVESLLLPNSNIFWSSWNLWYQVKQVCIPSCQILDLQHFNSLNYDTDIFLQICGHCFNMLSNTDYRVNYSTCLPASRPIYSKWEKNIKLISMRSWEHLLSNICILFYKL